MTLPTVEDQGAWGDVYAGVVGEMGTEVPTVETRMFASPEEIADEIRKTSWVVDRMNESIARSGVRAEFKRAWDLFRADWAKFSTNPPWRLRPDEFIFTGQRWNKVVSYRRKAYEWYALWEREMATTAPVSAPLSPPTRAPTVAPWVPPTSDKWGTVRRWAPWVAAGGLVWWVVARRRHAQSE